MAKTLTARTLLSKHVRSKDRVLLVNPPVEETRYSWLRWNQPLDLLKLASHLRSEVGCEVELLDFMKPDRQGHVPEEWLPRDRRYCTVKGHRYPMRRFGKPYGFLQDWLSQKRNELFPYEPSQVWITSLCSYWYESVAQMCGVVRRALPDSQVVLLGQYPRLMPNEAAQNCAADLVVSQAMEFADVPSALDLYGQNSPPFIAVRVNPQVTVAEVLLAVRRGILDVAFFEEDVCREGGQKLAEIVEKTQHFHKHLRYHIICGLNPASVTPAVARILAHKKFVQLHFEEADTGDSLDLEAYQKARAYLCEAGLQMPNERLSGFVWMGRPRDHLEELIQRSFHVLDCFGSLILKPYTPIPGSPEHKTHQKYLAGIDHRNWSPHFFPFAELNGISRDEYHDLYRMAAFLNEKVRARSFDFLNGTLGAQMLRDSLRREVWNLEPSPLRVID